MKAANILDYDEYREQIEEWGCWEPWCPNCKNESGLRVESDIHGIVTCESCDKQFRAEGL